MRSSDKILRQVRWALAAVFLLSGLASLLIVLNAVWTDLVVPVVRDQPWGPAAAGMLVIAAGLPVYYLFARRSRAVASTSA